jgi:two-component system phosphate regulon sensor histidine kinase PhoR
VASQADAVPPAALQDFVTGLAGRSALRLTVIAGDGTVLADSARAAGEVADMENHAQRPEVRGALTAGVGTAVRRSDTTGVDYAYAAQAQTLTRGRVVVVRLALPLQRLHVLPGQLAGTLALAAVAALAVMATVSWWLHRRLFVPLSDMVAGADALARGAFDHRLPVPAEQELATLAAAINRLAAAVQDQVAAAGAERDHLRAILASMSEGVLVAGDDGRALYANLALRRLLGLAGEVEGRSPVELVRQPPLAELVAATLREGRPQSGELQVPGAERRTLALTTAPLRGGGRGAVLVVRDVTPFLRLAETRRDFVANVSHELKSPLAAIRGYAETLRDGALAEPPTARRFIERILEQCARLQALLADLLTLSRLESVEAVLERAPVDLLALARRTADLAATAAAERGVAVAVAGEPTPVSGDAAALERLLFNLVDNAVKYNRRGGSVHVRVASAGGQAVVEVRDTGVGIPAEALPRVFERFYRVDQGRGREDGGTGLGLAIVKHVAQLHGGRVEVESEPGRGSLFRVVLPLAE